MDTNRTKDIAALREVTKRYLEIANHPDEARKREIWRKYHGFEDGPVPIVASAAGYFVWMKQHLDPQLASEEPFVREHEYELRRRIFHHGIGDDSVLVPWLTVTAVQKTGGRRQWGVEIKQSSDAETNARRQEYPLKRVEDFALVRPAPHLIDEERTGERYDRLVEAVGDLMPVDLDRGPWCARGFSADLSTDLGYLRGIESFMLDMHENPGALHRLLGVMRDGVLAAQEAAEQAGDLSLAGFWPQHPMPYARDMEELRPNSGPRMRSELWYFCAAQEFIGVSPEMHDEFMLRYQLPIVSRYKRVHYGCCEDLTRKIDMLRRLPNLSIVSVTPSADVRVCAERIGSDYLISWRPNPTDMVCTSWDEDRVRTITRQAREAMKGCRYCVHLKDVETLNGDLTRQTRWVALTRRLLS